MDADSCVLKIVHEDLVWYEDLVLAPAGWGIEVGVMPTRRGGNRIVQRVIFVPRDVFPALIENRVPTPPPPPELPILSGRLVANSAKMKNNAIVVTPAKRETFEPPLRSRLTRRAARACVDVSLFRRVGCVDMNPPPMMLHSSATIAS